MTRSTSTAAVIVLGDKDTGERVEMLATKAAEHGMAIVGTHTYEAGQPSTHHDLAELEPVVAALSQALGTRTNIWLPFPYDLLPEQHQRRLSMVLQRHGLNLLFRRDLWPAPVDGGYSEIDSALRGEVRAVDELDRVALAAAGMQTLSNEIELALQEPEPFAPREQLTDVLRRLEIQYGPHPGMPSTRASWVVREPGLRRFASWLVHQCEMTRTEAAELLNAVGHRTQTGRQWQRSTVSTLVNGRYGSQLAA